LGWGLCLGRAQTAEHRRPPSKARGDKVPALAELPFKLGGGTKFPIFMDGNTTKLYTEAKLFGSFLS